MDGSVSNKVVTVKPYVDWTHLEYVSIAEFNSLELNSAQVEEFLALLQSQGWIEASPIQQQNTIKFPLQTGQAKMAKSFLSMRCYLFQFL